MTNYTNRALVCGEDFQLLKVRNRVFLGLQKMVVTFVGKTTIQHNITEAKVQKGSMFVHSPRR
jgi:hypothetical protein